MITILHQHIQRSRWVCSTNSATEAAQLAEFKSPIQIMHFKASVEQEPEKQVLVCMWSEVQILVCMWSEVICSELLTKSRKTTCTMGGGRIEDS